MNKNDFLSLIANDMIHMYANAENDPFFKNRKLPEKIECGAYEKSDWFHKMQNVLKNCSVEKDRDVLETIILPYLEKKYYQQYHEDVAISNCSFDILTDKVSFSNEPLRGHFALGIELYIETDVDEDDYPDMDPYEYDHDDYDEIPDNLEDDPFYLDDPEDYEDYDEYAPALQKYVFLYEKDEEIKIYTPM